MNLELKYAICASGKTQRQLAAEIPILDENRLSQIVRGWVNPTDLEKDALAAALNQAVDALFGEQNRGAASSGDGRTR